MRENIVSSSRFETDGSLCPIRSFPFFALARWSLPHRFQPKDMKCLQDGLFPWEVLLAKIYKSVLRRRLSFPSRRAQSMFFTMFPSLLFRAQGVSSRERARLELFRRVELLFALVPPQVLRNIRCSIQLSSFLP